MVAVDTDWVNSGEAIPTTRSPSRRISLSRGTFGPRSRVSPPPLSAVVFPTAKLGLVTTLTTENWPRELKNNSLPSGDQIGCIAPVATRYLAPVAGNGCTNIDTEPGALPEV